MRWILLLVALWGLGLSQRANNGQQIAFGGIRFVELELHGTNQDNLPAIWRSGVYAPGRTLAYLPGWWWKGEVVVRARLDSAERFECAIGPLKSGPMVVIVVAQPNNRCLGDARNSSPSARVIERWLLGRSSQRKLDAVLRLVETAEDGWACVDSLIRRHEIGTKCQGVPVEALKALN